MALTISKRITIGFTASVLLTAALGGYTFSRLYSIRTHLESASTDSIPGVTCILQVQCAERASGIALTEHILAESNADIAAAEENVKSMAAQLAAASEAYEKTIFVQEDRELFDKVKAAEQEWQKAQDHILPLSRANKNTEAAALFVSEAQPALAKIDNAINAQVVYNQKEEDIELGEVVNAVRSGETGAIVGVITAILAAIGIAFVTIRAINKILTRLAGSMSSGSGQVSAAAQQVSGASQSLAQGASEQAASLEETSSSLEEMSSMTKKNADTARQASLLSAEAKTSADKGNQAMNKMGDAIDSIQKAATETAKIVKTIDEIAFQTNLLALNAAVEAARAGEAGKGFAVVAEEVRNLAMRSAEAAKTTSSLIEGSVASSKNGVAIAQEVAKTLAEIQGSVSKVNGLIAEIAAASQEQSTGIGQVNQAVQQMDKVTQSNAAASEESAAAAEELSGQSEQLRSLVSDLTKLVTGRADEERAAPAPRRSSSSRGKPTRLTPRTKASAEQAIPLDAGGEDKDFADFTVSA